MELLVPNSRRSFSGSPSRSSTSSRHSWHGSTRSEPDHSFGGIPGSVSNGTTSNLMLAVVKARAKLLLSVASVLLIALITLYHVDWAFDLKSPSSILYAPVSQGFTGLNYSKVATILEPRMSPTLVPLLLSYLSIVPDDWPFVVWCSTENYLQLTQSASLTRQMATGRLNITLLPEDVDIHNGEYLSRFLTKPWFYHQFHPEAEWMFFFQTDATLCSASEQTLDDWLGYEWVGSPTMWTNSNGHGGNGGLGIRKISLMQKLTADPTYVREDVNGKEEGVWFDNSEDYWFMTAIERALGDQARWPDQDGLDQNDFSLNSETEVMRPLGVHKGGGPWGIFGLDPDGDGNEVVRRFLHYCPEFSLIMDEQSGRFG